MSAPLAKSLIVNGEACDSTSATLAAFLTQHGYGTRKVATAVNGTFVPERQRAATLIATGDRIEIVAARQGG